MIRSIKEINTYIKIYTHNHNLDFIINYKLKMAPLQIFSRN